MGKEEDNRGIEEIWGRIDGFPLESMWERENCIMEEGKESKKQELLEWKRKIKGSREFAESIYSTNLQDRRAKSLQKRGRLGGSPEIQVGKSLLNYPKYPYIVYITFCILHNDLPSWPLGIHSISFFGKFREPLVIRELSNDWLHITRYLHIQSSIPSHEI